MLEILINGTPMGLCKADGNITKGRFVYKTTQNNVKQVNSTETAALAVGPSFKYIIAPEIDDADAETIKSGERLIYMVGGGVYKTDQVVASATDYDFGVQLVVNTDGRLRKYDSTTDTTLTPVGEVEEYVGDASSGVLTYRLYAR